MNALPSTLLGYGVWTLMPVGLLSLAALLLLGLELWPASARSNRGAVLTLLALLGAGAAAFIAQDVKFRAFSGMFVQDGFTVFFTLLFTGIAALVVLLSWDYVKRTRVNHAEFYALLLLATVGMIVMAASADLITVFLGLELMSLALYVLVGFRRSRLESNEAALKYFLLGAFASGFLLYGIALLYGATGTTNLNEMGAYLADTPLLANPMLVVGALLLLVGFAFKISAVPFHMWTPDAYEGAPTTVTAFMSAGAKAAGFAALLRVLLRALGGIHADWTPILTWVAILTMTVGNVTALLQNNVKRMLAYSSIAHAGYVLVAVVAGGPEASAAALFYLVAYSLMNLGAFGVLALLGRDQEERVLVGDLAGAGFRSPLLGLAMAGFMLSLGGIPPTAGFIAKVYVFGSAVEQGHVPLVIVAVLNSVVAVYYYLRVVVSLYMDEPAGEPVAISWAAPAALGIVLALILTFWWGVLPGSLLEQARASVLGLM
jgi:NADH-quinone oxidoreductase subunit N